MRSPPPALELLDGLLLKPPFAGYGGVGAEALILKERCGQSCQSCRSRRIEELGCLSGAYDMNV
jgi:hypothetical protein